MYDQTDKKKEIGQQPTNSHALTKKLDAPINSGHTPTQLFKASDTFDVFQLKTDVTATVADASANKTDQKEINTPTLGKAWFQFAIDGQNINSFSNNIYAGAGTKGGNPVSETVELGARATAEGKDYNVYEQSRTVHFGLGDRAIGKKRADRKGKHTWHHQDGQYYMELVDMYVHGGFGHHGGFSQWSEDLDDASDDGEA